MDEKDKAEFDEEERGAVAAIEAMARNKDILAALETIARVVVIGGEIALAVGVPGAGPGAETVLAVVAKALPIVLAKLDGAKT